MSAGVQLRPHATDGMAAVTALLTLPEARLLVQALEAYADAVPDDPENPRTRGQKMADCLLDLVLRPGETDAPSVQLVLTVVASVGTMTGGDEPGEDRWSRRARRDDPRSCSRRFAGRPRTRRMPLPTSEPAAAPEPGAGARRHATDRRRLSSLASGRVEGPRALVRPRADGRCSPEALGPEPRTAGRTA